MGTNYKEIVKNKDILDIRNFGQTDLYSLWNLYPTFGVKSLTGIDIEGITLENQKLFNIEKLNLAYEIITGNMELNHLIGNLM